MKPTLFIHYTNDNDRVGLYLQRSPDDNNWNGDDTLIAEMHPKHALDLLKVYNRTEESYDALYPGDNK